jgi:hypothetical protein
VRSAILILNLFAAVWALAALGSLGAPTWTWLLPVVVSGAIVGICWRDVDGTPVPPRDVRHRIARIVGFWSALEILLIAIAIAAAFRFGAERLIAPLVGIIVGLHFVALANSLPLRVYYATGLSLILVSAIALTVPGQAPLAITGFGAALVLWSTSLWIRFRSPRSQS